MGLSMYMYGGTQDKKKYSRKKDAQWINCTHYLRICTLLQFMPTPLPGESVPMASQSRILNKLFTLFHLLIMHREFINASFAHVLMMYHCALGILKF